MINREIMSKAQDLISEWEETDEPNALVLVEAILELIMPIVRELAESTPVAETESGGYYTAFCVFCHEENRFHEPIKHTDTCLWLRARKMAGME